MWQSGDVETDTIKLHYTRTGGSKPPIILLHGITDQGLCWTPVAAVLESDYDAIMVDARGHGLSEVPETDYAWLSHAEDVHRIIEGLGLEKPLILGHSMGAMSALLFASRYPALPRAILLEDPPPHWMPDEVTPERKAQRETEMRERLSNLKSKGVDGMIAEKHRESPRWSDEELGPWADAKLRASIKVMNMLKTDQDWSSLVTGVTCPVLLITADPAQGSAVTAEAAERLKSLVPQVRVEHIADAGHNIRREQFEAYMQVVTDFLNAV